MAKFERIFCENCGAEMNADLSQQYVKCDSCGSVINNPKYTEQSETFTQTTGNSGGFGGLFTEETKNGFNKLKGFFGGFGKENRNERHFEEDIHDDFGRRDRRDPFDDRRDPFDDRDDRRGGFGRRDGFRQEYYAVIEHTGMFYKGECPGISFTSTGLCRSYDECLDKLEEKLGDQIGSFNRTFDQPDPNTVDLDRDTRIVRVRPRR